MSQGRGNGSINNKFENIAINPPFGRNSELAFQHLKKAVIHLPRRGNRGKLYAILPNGPSMHKRLEPYFESRDFNNFRVTGKLILPGCTLERAGTKVGCFIIRIEINSTETNNRYEEIDLSYCNDINEFFDTIEDLDFS